MLNIRMEALSWTGAVTVMLLPVIVQLAGCELGRSCSERLALLVTEISSSFSISSA
jgi:hypothetical protein